MLAKNYCNHLFDKTTDGHLQIIEIEKDKKLKVYNTENAYLREIVEVQEGKEDIYMNVNTTYKPFRAVENIRQFRALYIDLDLKKDDFKTSSVYEVFWLANEGKIPKPTMVVDSGRGVHLYWRIENAPYGALNTWQQLEDYLYYNLKHLGADLRAIDGARILRLPGSINSKNKAICEVIYIDNKITYSMYDLREQYLNYKGKSKQLEFIQVKKNKSKVINNAFFNSYSLHMDRAVDLITLVKIRKYNVTGYRNMIIHCYAYWRGLIVREEEQLYKEIHDLNNSFTEPLKENEIKAVCKTILKKVDLFITYENELRAGIKPKLPKGTKDKPGYWYKNETLIERLDITEEEQGQLKTIISKEEKYNRKNAKRRDARRNEKGLTLREQQKQELINKVKELKLQGLSNIEIAKILGKNKSTIGRLLKNI